MKSTNTTGTPTVKPIKTLDGWHASNLDLSHYLSIGDVVDDGLRDYFLCVLPPACRTSKIIQIGEPYSHVNDRETFSTIERTADEANGSEWIYRGHCYQGEVIEP